MNIDTRVEIARVQAYRRAGRQTRKIDYMWLRGVLATDPLVVIDSSAEGAVIQSDRLILHFIVWHVSGGVALNLRVMTDPSLGPATDIAKDLPGAIGTHAIGLLDMSLATLRESVELHEVPGGQAGQFWLVARYRDDFDCEWESKRRISVLLQPTTYFPIDTEREPMPIPHASTSSTAEFSRRIVSLPPKKLASPAQDRMAPNTPTTL